MIVITALFGVCFNMLCIKPENLDLNKIFVNHRFISVDTILFVLNFIRLLNLKSKRYSLKMNFFY